MRFSINKDEFDYTYNRKKTTVFMTLLMLIIGLIIFFVGYYISGMTNKNMFTVVAVLFALPGAKFITRFVILFPSKRVDKEEYLRIKDKLKEPYVLYSGVVITSTEKVMYIKYIYIGNGVVYYLYDEKKKDNNSKNKSAKKVLEAEKKYIRDYIKKGVNNHSSGFKVRMFNDIKQFENELLKVNLKEPDNIKGEDEVIAYIDSLIV